MDAAHKTTIQTAVTDTLQVCSYKLFTFLTYSGVKANSSKVKVTLNLSFLRCMLFANHSHNFRPIVMKFGKHYFLVLRQLP